jgi:hypothetical protein
MSIRPAGTPSTISGRPIEVGREPLDDGWELEHDEVRRGRLTVRSSLRVEVGIELLEEPVSDEYGSPFAH